ncbi:MAG: MATE family multidrug resistance protein [Verrucomicrobiales bacterium]|jgi:MATE family multidrug resistance protein
MISTIGSAPLAALGPAAFLLAVPVCFGIGLVTSVNTFVAQSHGRDSRIHARCTRFGVQGIWLGVIFGSLALLLWPTARIIFASFRYSPELAAGASAYFEISLFAVSFQIATVALGGYFIGVRKAGIVLQGAAIGTGANIALNYWFIFGGLGVPALGLKGAALGTVCASAIHFFYALARFLTGLSKKDKSRVDWQPSRRTLTRLAKMGAPLGVHTGVDILSWGLVIFLIGVFGEADLAAATVVVRCIHLSFLPADGLGVALSNAISQAVGQGQVALAEAYTSIAFKIISIYMSTLGVLMFAFRHQILEAFSDDPTVIAIGSSAMIFACAAQFFDAMGITYYCALLGTGDNAWPMKITLSTTFIILGLGGLAMVNWVPQVGSLGIWFLDAIYVTILGLTFRLRWRSGHWQKIDIFED